MKNNMNHQVTPQSKDLKIIIEEAKKGKTDHLESMLKDIHVSRDNIYSYCDYAAVNLAANGHTDSIKHLQDLGIKMNKIFLECHKAAYRNGHEETAEYIKDCLLGNSILRQRKSYDLGPETAQKSNPSQRSASMDTLMNKFKDRSQKAMSDIDRLRAAEDVYHNRIEIVEKDKDGRPTGTVPLEEYLKKGQSEVRETLHKPEVRQRERQESRHNGARRGSITFDKNNDFHGGNIIMGSGTISGKVVQNGVEKDIKDFVEKREDGSNIVRVGNIDGFTFFGSGNHDREKDFDMSDYIKEQCKTFDKEHHDTRHGNRDEVYFGRMETSSIDGVFVNHGTINGKITMTDGKVDIDLGDDR